MARRVKYRTYFIKRSRSPTMFFIQLFLIFSRSIYMDVPLLSALCKHFKLVTHTSMTICTRLPRNKLDVPRGVGLSSCSTGRSSASKKSSFTLLNIKNNRRTFMRGKMKKRTRQLCRQSVTIQWLSC